MILLTCLEKSSMEELLDAKQLIEKEIKQKKKEEEDSKKEKALSKSGIDMYGGHCDVKDLKLLSYSNDILFLNWYVKVKLKYTGKVEKYIFSCNRDDYSQTTYIFDWCDNAEVMTAGKKFNVTIHDESLPYLLEEFREWSWTAI